MPTCCVLRSLPALELERHDVGFRDEPELPLVEAKLNSTIVVQLLVGSGCLAGPAVPCLGLRVRWYNPRLAEYSPEAGSRGDMLPPPGALLREFLAPDGQDPYRCLSCCGSDLPYPVRISSAVTTASSIDPSRYCETATTAWRRVVRVGCSMRRLPPCAY